MESLLAKVPDERFAATLSWYCHYKALEDIHLFDSLNKEHYVILTGSCTEKFSDTTFVLQKSATRLEEHIAESDGYKLALYPNPVEGELTIRLTLPEGSAAKRASFAIYDLAGKLLYNSDRFVPAPGLSAITHDVSALSSGMYILQVKTEKKQLNAKFLVQ